MAEQEQKKLPFGNLPTYHLVYYELQEDGKKKGIQICGLWPSKNGYSGKVEKSVITKDIRIEVGTFLNLFNVEPKSESKKF